MNHFLANSGGQTLKNHLVATMNVAMHCAKEILGVDDQDLINVVGLSAFFHDIGKCTLWFQEFTLKELGKDPETLSRHYPNYNGDKKKDFYPRHNEISWIYAAAHAKPKSNLFKSVGLQAIYWHHGTYLNTWEILDQGNPRTTKSIINEMAVFDSGEVEKVFDNIKSIISSVNFPFDISQYIENDRDNFAFPVPRLFETEAHEGDISNAQRWVIRSCVVFADHVVSSLTKKELDDLLEKDDISKFLNLNTEQKSFEVTRPENYSADRFKLQQDIIKECSKTTLVKAPAGFGKSLIGILWGLQQHGQVYWVCPRNTVAEGVYKNICDELKALNIDVSVELFLTSERVSATDKSIDVCKSDIVVTNIDNLLSPMVNHKHCVRIFDINISNVVFDEFHEFINDEAMFSAFITYMRARNSLCSKAKTLLLSATPSVMHCLWDSGISQTKILPDSNAHYPAQHDEKYSFSFTNEFVSKPAPRSLTMYSSIKNVQEQYSNGYNIIAHSKYADEDRQAIMKNIFDLFGKNGTAKNECVISAPVLQAALNISFESLYKTIESPECDIQTIGRVNRWGENSGITKINFIDLFDDRRERSAIVARYNLTIARGWAAFLKDNCVSDLALNEIYVLYNKFNNTNKTELLRFLKARNKSSLEKLLTFFPLQRNNTFTKGDKIIATKTLRNNRPSTFVVVKDDSDNWCNFVFSVDEIEKNDLVADNRMSVESSTLETVWANLNVVVNNNNEPVFDYTELTKKFFGKKTKKFKLKAEQVAKAARCSDTPLPVWTMKYNRVLGLVEVK